MLYKPIHLFESRAVAYIDTVHAAGTPVVRGGISCGVPIVLLQYVCAQWTVPCHKIAQITVHERVNINFHETQKIFSRETTHYTVYMYMCVGIGKRRTGALLN